MTIRQEKTNVNRKNNFFINFFISLIVYFYISIIYVEFTLTVSTSPLYSGVGPRRQVIGWDPIVNLNQY